ncbi:MAG: group 1 truncated hemoglobin [Alphaproteobacteria bacterium]|nr:group 1 truncated hemoglobin [Alphaproteobacteria bacterium]OJV14047.1 MAG: group 1 truncated hemoglobin [Alphaproteobacteria bacterium 33-17]
MSNLFERIGGVNAVNTAVDIFYRKVLNDNTINHFFKNIDMEKQIAKQKSFLTYAFGGPNNYTGKDMREGHKHMKLTDAHFDSVVGHLASTLQELGVAANDISEVAKIAESVRSDVLNK